MPQDNAIALEFPVLYTEADTSLLGLEQHFIFRTPDTTDFSGKHLILACQSERKTQKLARAIKRANPEARISVHPPMENELLIQYSGFPTFMGELLYSMDYEEWDKSLESPLNCERYQELATDIIEEHLQGLIKESEESKLLDFLKERATVGDYVVDKRWLEPLRAELEKRYKSKSADRPALLSGENPGREIKPSIEQQVYMALFARYCYATIADKIHKYAETHYEPVEDGEIEREIIEYLEQEFIGKERPATSQSCLNWLKKRTYVSPKKVNCGGINLKNGILDITIDENGDVFDSLTEHTPERIFTFCSDVEYKREIIPSESVHLNTLLSCLDEPYRTIFVRTLAASLALPEVRKRLGRGVKSLLMTGTGSNGKDTVMLPIQYIFGEAMTGVTSVSMLQYDDGRKFGCYGIVGSLINYNTEAKKVAQLAECSFLKALVTGDSVSIEQKNKDEHLYKPQCIALFSTNEDAKFRNGSEAVKSRYAEIPFKKTYSTHPKKPGELKADPRFHDDPHFIKSEVAPAFINLLLLELDNLLKHGINYSATDADMDDDRYNNDRIYRYFTDKDIVEVPGGKSSGVYITLNDAWQIYLDGLERDGVDDDQRMRNNKLYCPDKPNFSTWVKTSFRGVAVSQKRIGGIKLTVLWGLTYSELSHVDIPDTVSVSAQPVAQPELSHAQPTLASDSSVAKPVYEVAKEVAKLESLPSMDCLSGLADCTELSGQFVAVYPGTKEDYRQCRVFRPKQNKPWFWCLFVGESEPQKVPADLIEPDPNEF